uniref:Unidentified protein n=1 Tax=Porphyra purpurea TaxID=2787 RepID=O99985_PORPU|nr:unidentified protein [Porphyra purpurea]AAD03113.1 unidentified protein [Porphyra purpurea]
MKTLNFPTISLTSLHVLALFIVICYHNIYIFTEESILLFCFIAWVNITWTYLSPQISSSLEERTHKIYLNFQQVATNNIISWKNYRQGYSFKTLHTVVLNSLVPHLAYFIQSILLLESKSKSFQAIAPYLKRLNVVKDLENKLIKISYSIICQRIQDVTFIREFYGDQLSIKSFNSESKLDMLERIRKLEEQV